MKISRELRGRNAAPEASPASTEREESDVICPLRPLCPLCGRELIDGPSVNEHHLIPRSHRGRGTVRMHRICHNKIHAVFSERELARYYHTMPRLLENEEIRKFVGWVQKKHPAFHDAHDRGGRRR